MKTIRDQLMESIQGVLSEDATQCDECGAAVFGSGDADLAFAEHDDEECMVGVHMVALYLVEHVTGKASDTSRRIVKFLREQNEATP